MRSKVGVDLIRDHLLVASGIRNMHKRKRENRVREARLKVKKHFIFPENKSYFQFGYCFYTKRKFLFFFL